MKLSKLFNLLDDGHDHDPVVIEGTVMADLIEAGGGPQAIYGFNGEDTIRAGGGPDDVFGGNGGDLLQGQGGPDRMFGGNGRDVLEGGPGPDVLDGGNGDDVLIGGVAADVLTGGRGADVFVFLAASDAPAHGEDEAHEDDGHEDEGLETITDFQIGTDLIDLSAIGGVTGFADGVAAHSAWAEQVGGDTLLWVDTDGNIAGDSPAEMQILLLEVDAAALGADDFIF